MNVGFSCSKGAVVFAAVAVTAAGAMLWLRSGLASRAAEHRSRSASLENELSSRIAAYPGYGAADRDSLEVEVRRFRDHMGPPGTWEAVALLFARRWGVGDEQSTKSGDFTTRSCTFRMQSPTAADWPEILETVKDFEGIPGAAVVEFQMKAGGDHEHRALETVRMLVSVRTRRSDNEPPSP